MKMIKLLSLILVIVFMVPIMASCTYSETATSGTDSASYVQPAPVVITKTVPMPVQAPDIYTRVVIVPPRPIPPPAPFRWPWHRP
jgi:hypothetical protein